MSRIAGRCAIAETNVTFDYGEDSVIVCIDECTCLALSWSVRALFTCNLLLLVMIVINIIILLFMCYNRLLI